MSLLDSYKKLCSDQDIVDTYSSSAMENKGIKFKFFNSNLRDYTVLFTYASQFKEDLNNINNNETKATFREKYKQHISRLEGIEFITRNNDLSFSITTKCLQYLEIANLHSDDLERLFLSFIVSADGEFGIKNQFLIKTSDIISTIIANLSNEKSLYDWVSSYDSTNPLNNKLYWAFSFYDQANFIKELESSSEEQFKKFLIEYKEVENSIISERTRICGGTINTELRFFVVGYKLLSGLSGKFILSKEDLIDWIQLCWLDSLNAGEAKEKIRSLCDVLKLDKYILLNLLYESIRDLLFKPSSIQFCIEKCQGPETNEEIKLATTEHQILLDGNNESFNSDVTQDDYLKANEENTALGEAGEYRVYKKLCTDYSEDKVFWVSSYAKKYISDCEVNDSAGYDIKVETPEGTKYFEVKTTDKNTLHFFISTNEILTAQRSGEKYSFYIVKKENNDLYRIMKLHNIFKDFTFKSDTTTQGFTIKPIKWRVKLEILKL